jgi:hypothetical protein
MGGPIMMRHAIGLVLGLVLLLPPAAASAADAPQTTGPFLTFCATNSKDCLSAVQVDQIATTITGDGCLIPHGIEYNAGDQQIVAWMRAHPASADQSVHASIQAAIKGLWNCQDAVNTGMTSLGVPDKAALFVAYCDDKSHYNKCATEVVGDTFAIYAGNQGMNESAKGHCSPHDDIVTKPLTDKVMTWLRAHPSDQDTERAIWSASDALWPCH